MLHFGLAQVRAGTRTGASNATRSRLEPLHYDALGRLGARATVTPARPVRRSVGGARNVLTLLAVGFTIWLYVGALTAQLFGAFVSGGRWDRDEDD
jgi:hypothetical protein